MMSVIRLTVISSLVNNCFRQCRFSIAARRCRTHPSSILLSSSGVLYNSQLSSRYACTATDTKSDDNTLENHKMASELCDQINKQLQQSKQNHTHQASLPVILTLLNSNVSAKSITENLCQHPTLLAYPAQTWGETVNLLKSYSFRPNQVLPMISGSPSLLAGSSRIMLKDVLALLRSLGIAEGKRQRIVEKNPKLLRGNDTKPILNRYQKLMEVFTKSEVQALMLSNPAVLSDSWEDSEEKLDYVYGTMGIRSQEILKSRMFKHTLLHIMTRHQFVVRAGLYQKPGKHELAAIEDKRPSPVVSKNLSLAALVDSSDAEFVRAIGANFTLEEYRTFTEMMLVEQRERDLSTDSGSDVDGDYESSSDDEN